jgi:hypothetical protein
MENNLDEMNKKAKETDEGYLSFDSTIVTNVGVFSYLQKDGTVIRELRDIDEVFSPESLETLAMKPVTDDHPSEKVTADNIKDYSIGNLGSEVIIDGYHIALPLSITNKDAVMKVKSGKKSLSCGYTADIEFKSGNWKGVQYDAIQRNIRYNHVALVDKGRAGDSVVLRLDSDAILIDTCKKDSNINKEKGDNKMTENLKTIKFDEVEYKAEAEVIKKYSQSKADSESLSKEIEVLKSDSSKLQAEKDTLQDKVDSLEAKIKELEERKIGEKEINDAVEAKIALLKVAEKAGVEVIDGMDQKEIKKAIILKVSPKANLDGKDDTYISARFDGVAESLEEKEIVIKDEKDAEIESLKGRSFKLCKENIK